MKSKKNNSLIFLSVYAAVMIFAFLALWSFVSYCKIYEQAASAKTYKKTAYKNYLNLETDNNYRGSACGDNNYPNNYCPDTYLPVNRTYDYLCDEACKFAKIHNMYGPVLNLYQNDGVPLFEKRNRSRSRRKKKTVSNKSYSGFPGWNGRKINPRFIFPIDKKKFWLSSPFGKRKKVDGSQGFHYGIDMAAMHRTPVKAAGNGVVIEAGVLRGYGKTIVIKHDNRYKTRYAHLSALLVTVGKRVTTGMIIGRVGATGNVRKSGKDPSHLHFEVELDGKRRNPFYFFK